MPDYRAEYGVIAGNPSINETIYRCFKDLPDAIVRKLASKLKREAGNEADTLAAPHTFRELVIGAYLARNRSPVAYEREISGKTPDWTIQPDEQPPGAIVDVLNYHLAHEKAAKAARDQKEGRVAVYYPENEKRLGMKVDEKAGAYEALAKACSLPFVIALFGHFDTGVADADDLTEAGILGDADSVFASRPGLSGLSLVTDANGTYSFQYFANPHALYPYRLPDESWRHA